MAYQSRGNRSRSSARDHLQLANGRLRGLSIDNHPYRWCPAEEVTILVGPDRLCPACGKLTTPR